MRVRELIEQLKDFDPEQMVVIESTGGNSSAVVPNFVTTDAMENSCGNDIQVVLITGDGT